MLSTSGSSSTTRMKVLTLSPGVSRRSVASISEFSARCDLQGRTLSSTSVLMPVGRCSPGRARSSAHKKHELLHTIARDREEHHQPRGERSAPQQSFDRLRHAIPPKKCLFQMRRKLSSKTPITITHEKPPGDGNLADPSPMRPENFARIPGSRKRTAATGPARSHWAASCRATSSSGRFFQSSITTMLTTSCRYMPTARPRS